MGQTLLLALGVLCPPRTAFAGGLVAGALGIAASFHWGLATLQSTLDASLSVAGLLFALLVTMEAIPFALTALATAWAIRRGPSSLWLVAGLWAVLEWLYPRLFAWRLAYSQLEVLPLLQVCELAGSTSVGFVMTAAAAVPLVLWRFAASRATAQDRRKALAYAAVAGGLLAGVIAYGQVRRSQLESWLARQPVKTIALVQVDPALVGSEEKLRQASLMLDPAADWICWPETALGTYCETLSDFRDVQQVRALSRDTHLLMLQPAADLPCPLLAGARLYPPSAGEEGPYAMAALLIGPDQRLWGKYRKQTLMPLGEYVPGQQWLPALRHWATIKDELTPGNDPRPLKTPQGAALGVLLCYEDTLPRHARRSVALGAQLLVSLIQGTAFEHPRTLVQHQRLAVLRAVENRRYFARCASTGMTCLISPTGRVLDRLPLLTEGVLQGGVVLLDHHTPYTIAGEWFPMAWVLVLLAVAGRWAWRRRVGCHSAL